MFKERYVCKNNYNVFTVGKIYHGDTKIDSNLVYIKNDIDYVELFSSSKYSIYNNLYDYFYTLEEYRNLLIDKLI